MDRSLERETYFVRVIIVVPVRHFERLPDLLTLTDRVFLNTNVSDKIFVSDMNSVPLNVPDLGNISE
jgi:hypothetical protein